MDPSARATPVAPARRGRFLLRFLVVVTVLVALYGVLLGLVAPPIAKRVAADRIGKAIGRTVTIDEVTVNPYTLRAAVGGVRVMEPDGKAVFASLERIEADASVSSAWKMAPVVEALDLRGLKVNVVREGESRFNFSDILERLAKSGRDKAAAGAADEPRAPARFSIANIRLHQSAIDFDDRLVGKRHAIEGMRAAIPFISSLPVHRKDFVQPEFAANVNGAAFHLTGETLPFEDSLQTRFVVDLQGVDVRRYLAYIPFELPVKVESGAVDARLALRFTQGKKDPSVDLSGRAALRRVAVSAEQPLARLAALEVDIKSFDPLRGHLSLDRVALADALVLPEHLLVPALEARGIVLDLRKRDARIASVQGRDGAVALARNADGSIVMPRLLPVKTPAHEPPAVAAPAAPPWNVLVDNLKLVGWNVTLADGAANPATTHRVAIDSLEVRELGNRDGVTGQANARLMLGSGRVELAARFALEPLQVNATIDARNVDLVPLRAYVTDFPTVALKSGNASAKGQLVVRGTPDALQLSWRGGAEIAQLATVDTAKREALLSWKSVRASAVELDLAPGKPVVLGVGEVVVDGIYSRLVVNPDGTLNVQSLKTGAPPAKGPAAPEPPPRKVRIDRVTFVNGRLDFTDHFIRPNYSADVGELQGTVTGLSSEPEARATVDLKGRYDQTSPVVIAGTVNPLRGDLFVDVAAKGADIELPKLTAYSQRYAGYGIKAGKLTLDVKYHIDGGKLDGRNKVVIDQLTFGDKVESPDATTLPVLFAVNLLKDADGRIDLELPIKGSLDDPQFEIGALVTQVIGNLLKKAVTAPFSLLAAALGGGGGNGGSGNGGGKGQDGSDLAFVDFEPGASELADPARGKLESLVKALQQRPGLKLELLAGVDPKRDTEALKRAELGRRLEAMRAGDKAAGDEGSLLRRLAIQEKVIPVADTAKDKPASGGKEAPITPAQLEALLLERIQVSEQLDQLARQRGEQARSYLVAEGRLPADRVVMGERAEGTDATRVSFTLR